MSMHIIGTLAAARIAPADLRELIRSRGIATSEHTYNGKALFRALTERYGWVPDIEDCVCLDSGDLNEIQPVILPDGRKGSMYVCWPDCPETASDPSWPVAYLLNVSEDNAEDGMRLCGYERKDGSIRITYVDELDLCALTNDSGYEKGWCDMYFFEEDGKAGYACDYGFGSNIREITLGKMDQFFSSTPSDNPSGAYQNESFRNLRKADGQFNRIHFRQIAAVDQECFL